MASGERDGSGPSRQNAAPASQSRTITEGGTATQRQLQPATQAILRLRGAPTSTNRSVQWAEDVVDNEGLGRKKSKVCCIYHRPKEVGESSDESSSDSSSSSSDSDSDGPGRKEGCSHGKKCGHGQGRRKRGKGNQGQEKRPPSPNAYEKMPKPKPKDPPDAGGDKGKAAA